MASPSFLASGHQTLLRSEGGPVYSTATLSILASMPSRTIGEWTLCPHAWVGLGFQLGICGPRL